MTSLAFLYEVYKGIRRGRRGCSLRRANRRTPTPGWTSRPPGSIATSRPDRAIRAVSRDCTAWRRLVGPEAPGCRRQFDSGYGIGASAILW